MILKDSKFLSKKKLLEQSLKSIQFGTMKNNDKDKDFLKVIETNETDNGLKITSE